jgi:hypothetical protein
MVANKNGLAASSALITLIMVLALISTIVCCEHANRYEGGHAGWIMALIIFLASLYPTVFIITQTAAAFNASNAIDDVRDRIRRRRSEDEDE